MKPILLTLAATLAFSATVFAGPPHKSGGPSFHDGKTSIHGNNNVHVSNHKVRFEPTFKNLPNFGVKFSGGIFYHGYQHPNWSRVYWNSIYGCRIYCCPFTMVEYYWCPWDHRYYPVTYRPYGRIVF